MQPTITNVILDIAALYPSNSAFYELSTIPMKPWVSLYGSTGHRLNRLTLGQQSDLIHPHEQDEYLRVVVILN